MTKLGILLMEGSGCTVHILLTLCGFILLFIFLFNFLKSRVDRRDVYPELDDFDPFH